MKKPTLHGLEKRILEIEASDLTLKARLSRLEASERERAATELQIPGHSDKDRVDRQVASIIDMIQHGRRTPIAVGVSSAEHAELLQLELLSLGMKESVEITIEAEDCKREG